MGELPTGNFSDDVLNIVVLSSKGDFCFSQYCFNSEGRWVQVPDSEIIKIPKSFLLVGYERALPEPERRKSRMQELASLHHLTRVVRIGKSLVFEQLLFDVVPPGQRGGNYPRINAVHQSESLDNGKTWSVLTITINAKLFELGKSLKAQAFVGFPYSSEGKRFNEKRPLQ